MTVWPLSMSLCSCLGNRDIKSLPVRCDYVQEGCTWEGTVRTLEEHTSKCRLPCPNRCGNTQLLGKELEKHLKHECPNRDYKCIHCGKKGMHAQIMNIHDPICEKKVISCPNTKCTREIRREELTDHLENDCEYVTVPCKHKNIGCLEKLERRDMRAHEEDDKVHLQHAINAVVRLQHDLRSSREASKKAIEKLTEKIVLRKREAFTFKLTEYEKRKADNEMFQSKSLYFKGYHMRIVVYPNGTDEGKGTHVSLYAHLQEGDYDKELNWPFIGSFTFELLNQLANKRHFEWSITADERDNLSAGSDIMAGSAIFIAHTDLHYNRPNRTQYLKDDTLYFRVSADTSDSRPWLECTTTN